MNPLSNPLEALNKARTMRAIAPETWATRCVELENLLLMMRNPLASCWCYYEGHGEPCVDHVQVCKEIQKALYGREM